MNIFSRYTALISSGAAIAIFSASLAAQDLGQMRDIAGKSGLGDAASSLGSLSSITSGSIANAAGVIDFCGTSNYLSGEGATSVKNQLLEKAGASGNKPAESNPDYIKGKKGIVITAGGQSVDLSMAGLKEAAVKKACEQILEQGKALLR